MAISNKNKRLVSLIFVKFFTGCGSASFMPDASTNDSFFGGINNPIARAEDSSTDSESRCGSAHMNGTNGSIIVPTSLPNYPSSVTVAAWFYPSTVHRPNGETQGIVTWKSDSYGGHNAFSLEMLENGYLVARVQTAPCEGEDTCVNQPFVDVRPPRRLIPGNWYHITATYDSAVGSLILYLDSNVLGATDGTPNTSIYFEDHSQPLVIGSEHYNGAIGQLSQGNISDVVVLPRAVESYEIAQLRAGSGNRARAIGIWPLDDQTGPTARDVSGNNRNGTFQHSQWLTSGPNCR